MGVSTDAILFYGYCWKEETNLFDDDESEGWEQIVLRKRGEKSPWDAYPREAHAQLPYMEKRKADDQWAADNRGALDAWYAKLKAVREEFGVDISHHCSDGCAMPYVYAKQFIVSRGYPEVVTADKLAVDPAWGAMIERFLTELGIARPEGQDRPQWWLASYWG